MTFDAEGVRAKMERALSTGRWYWLRKDLAAALDEIDALRAAMAASAEEAAPGTLTPREQRIYAAGFEFGLKAAAEGARLAAERGLAGEGT